MNHGDDFDDDELEAKEFSQGKFPFARLRFLVNRRKELN